MSGDYGSGFFGYAVNTSTYVLKHKQFGWLALRRNLSTHGNNVSVSLTTAAKSSIYFEPLGLWIPPAC
jgi:hypothetical protein